MCTRYPPGPVARTQAALALPNGQPVYFAVPVRQFRPSGFIPVYIRWRLALVVGALAVLGITPVASAQAPDASAQTPADPPASAVSRPPELDPSAFDARYADAIANAQRVMRAVPLRAEEQVVLDGILEEPVWQRAQPATDFIQQDRKSVV